MERSSSQSSSKHHLTYSMISDLKLLYLDRAHVDDRQFVHRLARRIGVMEPGTRCILVHGGGDAALRALEGSGRFPEWNAGAVQAETEEERTLVHRAVRDLNQQIVTTLTDQVVPSVGVSGANRDLLVLDEGEVAVRGGGWLEALVKQGVLPVVAAEAATSPGEPPAELSVAAVVRALARAFEEMDPVIYLFPASALPEEDAGAAAFADAHSEPEEVRRLPASGVPVQMITVDAVGSDWKGRTWPAE